MKNISALADKILKEAEEKIKSDNFFLGKNNLEIKKKFEERQRQADQHARNNLQKGITWSPTVNWHGFVKHFSYAKTLDGRQLFKTEAEGMIELAMNGKKTYMSKEEFERHEKKIENFCKKTNSRYFGEEIWHS